MSMPGRILYFCLMNYLIISGMVGWVRKIHIHFTFCLSLATVSQVIKNRQRSEEEREGGRWWVRKYSSAQTIRELVVDHNLHKRKFTQGCNFKPNDSHVNFILRRWDLFTGVIGFNGTSQSTEYIIHLWLSCPLKSSGSSLLKVPN